MALLPGMLCLPICFALLCNIRWTVANKRTLHDSHRLVRAHTGLARRFESQKVENARFSRLSLKKLLKRKRRKLKRLSHEINTLKQHLNDHTKRVFSNDSSAENGFDMLCKKRRKAVDTIWKKKIEDELVIIHSKLSRINNALKKSYKIASQNASLKTTVSYRMARLLNSLKKQRLRGNSQSKSGPLVPRKGPKSSDLLVSTSSPFAKKPLIFDLSVKKYGSRGSVCKNHRQCKPGLCCHDGVPLEDFPSSNGSVCVQHSLKEGQSCLDSCQCELGLNCFRGRSTVQMDPNPQNDRSITSQCKIASMDDVLLGEYVTDRDSVFHGDHRNPAEKMQM